MGRVRTAAEASPNTPASGFGVFGFDSTVKLPYFKNDAGKSGLMGGATFNAAIAAVSGFSADTYITDSDLLIPSFGLQLRSTFLWRISASKTALGVAQPIYTVRIGSARTTTDTSRLALTGPAQTAIADIGTLCVMATIRAIGASGVLQGTAWWEHRGTAASSTIGVGFANDGTGHVEGTSSAFDTTALAGQFVGLSINGGASAAWTSTQVLAEARW